MNVRGQKEKRISEKEGKRARNEKGETVPGVRVAYWSTE